MGSNPIGAFFASVYSEAKNKIGQSATRQAKDKWSQNKHNWHTFHSKHLNGYIFWKRPVDKNVHTFSSNDWK